MHNFNKVNVYQTKSLKSEKLESKADETVNEVEESGVILQDSIVAPVNKTRNTTYI